MKSRRDDYYRERSSKRIEIAIAIILGLLLGFLLRTFVVKTYKISSDHMENTFLAGDFVLVEKLTYKFRDPQPGELVVFKYPINVSKQYLKRVIATEGEFVRIRNKVVYVDGEPLQEPKMIKYEDGTIYPSIISNRDNLKGLELPEDCYFVLGDNRDNSDDSRFWGELDKEFIIGRPLVIYFSWRPDPAATEWTPPYILSTVRLLLYNAFHFFRRVRWERIGERPK